MVVRSARRGMQTLVRTVAAALVAVVGCATPAERLAAPVAVTPRPQVASEEALGPGDVLEVKVFREPDLSGTFSVGGTGIVDFPLVGPVDVEGKSPDAIASELRRRLSDGYLMDPHVSVFIKEHMSQKVHVLGEVQKSGSFSYTSGMSIIEAITTAGGFTKLAATNRVKVTRSQGTQEKTFEVQAGDIGSGNAPNFMLEPGDIVYVPEAIF